MTETRAAPKLRRVRQRLTALRNKGLEPMEAIMSPATWDALQAQHRAATPGMLGRLAGRDLLGIRVKLQPDSRGVVLRYFGGMEFDEES